MYTHFYLNEIILLEIIILFPRDLDYLTKFTIPVVRNVLSTCWSEEAKRVPSNIGYCYYTWLPLRI